MAFVNRQESRELHVYTSNAPSGSQTTSVIFQAMQGDRVIDISYL